MSRVPFILIAAAFISAATAFGQTGGSASDRAKTAKKKEQTTGFYGKRFTLQLGAGFNHNTILKLASSREHYLRDQAYYSNYREKINKDQFNYSFYGNMGIVLKERVALSFDFNYYMGNIFLQNIGAKSYYDSNYNYVSIPGYDARVKYSTIRIMPRIEIGSEGANMPVGLVNVLGIGVEISKLKSGSYQSITSYDSYYYNPDGPQIANRNLSFRDESVFNLTLMYGLEYRLAISKNIAWNFGGYVHMNIPIQEMISEVGISSSYNYYSGTDYENEHKLQLSRYRFQNLFSMRTGLVIML